MKNIWVLCGGPSTEFEVSLSSGRVVCERIRLDEYVVRPVVITRSRRWILAERVLEKDSDRAWLATFFKMAADPSSTKVGLDVAEAAARMIGEGVHCAFLALHGQFGEDGAVQGFLETLGIPYTGSGVLASAIAFHKILSLDIFRGAGLTTPRGMRVHRETAISEILEQLQLPVFVKPVRGGSSVGMSYVEKEEDLAPAIALALATDTEALVEEKVDGVEVSCGVLDLVRDGNIVSTPLPPTEIRPLESAYFDYEAKYRPGKSKEITPANLQPTIIRKIQLCALRAHQALGCEGMSRTDMIVREDGEPVVLETNTIPGMTPTSLLPQQAEAIGMSFADFLDTLITHASQREQLRCKQTGGH
ncbi:MAG: D-alanine--D-alanine ligase [Candidatus Sumerlaea chitinivorans]|uniref:D-alanine--D-alanine ligase n=1 Tax=Sumerlaea chitinivorans TaxID=2250252 RepID=A0A2Z4Y7I6_SUMC1|nr:D-alanine--D-alanine ligase [Candidatus Sumerlaea chitinivorans]MCX7963615.1 D-alanine--D-alanine ligase [Candidatus Sumerlaea chitinivorans]